MRLQFKIIFGHNEASKANLYEYKRIMKGSHFSNRSIPCAAYDVISNNSNKM